MHGVNGDDDETTLPATTDPAFAPNSSRQRLLVVDLTAAGSAFLAGIARSPTLPRPHTSESRSRTRSSGFGSSRR